MSSRRLVSRYDVFAPNEISALKLTDSLNVHDLNLAEVGKGTEEVHEHVLHVRSPLIHVVLDFVSNSAKFGNIGYKFFFGSFYIASVRQSLY